MTEPTRTETKLATHLRECQEHAENNDRRLRKIVVDMERNVATLTQQKWLKECGIPPSIIAGMAKIAQQIVNSERNIARCERKTKGIDPNSFKQEVVDAGDALREAKKRLELAERAKEVYGWTRSSQRSAERSKNQLLAKLDDMAPFTDTQIVEIESVEQVARQAELQRQRRANADAWGG